MWQALEGAEAEHNEDFMQRRNRKPGDTANVLYYDHSHMIIYICQNSCTFKVHFIHKLYYKHE